MMYVAKWMINGERNIGFVNKLTLYDNSNTPLYSALVKYGYSNHPIDTGVDLS